MVGVREFYYLTRVKTAGMTINCSRLPATTHKKKCIPFPIENLKLYTNKT